MDFPIWAIICAVAGVFALLFTGLAFFLIKRKRKSSPSTVDIAQDEKMNFQQKQKKQAAERHLEQEQQNNKTATMNPHQLQTNNKQPSTAIKSSHYHPVNNKQVEKEEEEDLSVPKTRKMSRTERKQHQDNVKINLPLPPPSTSLFSDKMELSSEEAMELFDKYMNIDKSSDAEKPSFYSSVRRKTGTIRSTVRQSLRRQKSTKSTTPLNQLFGEQQQPSTPSSATSVEAYHNLLSGRPSTTSLPSAPQTPVHAAIKPPSPVIPPVAHRQQQDQYHHNTDDYQEEEEVEEVKIPQAIEAAAAAAYSDGKNNNASMRAARRVIRTASRKSKTRSMLVNEEDVMKMFAPSPVAAEYRDNIRSNAANFATVRENRTTGSVRRLVRDSIVTDKSATISAVSATTAGNNRSAASATNARDIAEWWSPEDTNKPAKVEATSNNNNKMPPPPRMPGKLVDEQKGNVDTIRRMLQASMTESGSMTSIVTATKGRFSNEGLEGPDPVASFSSSTVRTMIPENDEQHQQKQQQQSQHQQQSFGAAGIAAQEKIEIDGTNFAMLQQNGHQTWNGRTNRISNRPSILTSQQQAVESLSDSNNTYTTDDDSYNSKSFFNTVNLGRRQSAKRKVMPWMDMEDTKRTPAQRERDHYLQSLYDQA